jgi:hypothetical protein
MARLAWITSVSVSATGFPEEPMLPQKTQCYQSGLLCAVDRFRSRSGPLLNQESAGAQRRRIWPDLGHAALDYAKPLMMSLAKFL